MPHTRNTLLPARFQRPHRVEPLNSKPHQFFKQIRVRKSRSLAQFWEHTDVRKARNRVYLVKEKRAGLFVKEKVDSAESASVQRFERFYRNIADFVYYRRGIWVVEDAKGDRTDVYIIKRKLMLEKYGIEIEEV